MVLFKPGIDCPVCHRPIEAGDAKVGFRPFVANEADPLFVFNDVAVHSECLQHHPLGAEVEERYRATLAENTYAKRVCLVCGEQISTPDEYFGLGHLTNDTSDELYKFNFKHFHNRCLPSWNALSSVQQLAEEKLRTGAWQGVAMHRLVESLSEAIAKV